MDTKRPRGSERSKPCHKLRELSHLPWPPGSASGASKPFRERCSGCHGVDGSGSPFAPALTRSQYNHGDSDLAIYKVLRDGVPGTAMQSAGLTLLERLEVISHLKELQSQQSEARKPQALPLAIQVSDDRLLAAGTHPDEWLMYSGSYNGWRYTPAAEITPANIAELKLRWVDNSTRIVRTPKPRRW